MEPGTKMTCANPDCDCQVTIDKPCPHGEDYRCGCGGELVPATAQQ